MRSRIYYVNNYVITSIIIHYLFIATHLILDPLRFLSRVLYDLVLLMEREQLLDLDLDNFLLTVLSLNAGLSDRRRLRYE